MKQIYCFLLSLAVALTPIAGAEGDVTAQWQACIEKPQHQCVLSLAEEMAKQTDYIPYRVEALIEIAKIHAKTDNIGGANFSLNNALRLVEKYEGSYPASHNPSLAIVTAWAEIGNFIVAESTAQQIYGDNFTWALANIAIAQAETGDINNAILTAQPIRFASYRVYLLNGIAIAQAKAGDMNNAKLIFEDALKAAQEYDNNSDYHPKTYPWQLMQIAIAQNKAGNIENAKTAAQKIGIDSSNFRSWALINIVFSQIEAGDLKGAKLTAQQISDTKLRSWAQMDIAAAQIKAGDIDNAKITTQHIEHVVFRAASLRNIAIAQAEKGAINDAEITARKIDDMKSLMDAVYMKDQQASNPDAVYTEEKDIEEAMKKQISSAWHLANRVLEDIILSQIREEDVNDSVATDLKINNADLDGDYMLHRIAVKQAQFGKSDDAVITALKIDHEVFRDSALKDIVIAQTEAGNFKNAIATVREIGGADDMLEGIVTAQAQAGDFTGAMQTARSINDNAKKPQALLDIAKVLAEKNNPAITFTTSTHPPRNQLPRQIPRIPK